MVLMMFCSKSAAASCFKVFAVIVMLLPFQTIFVFLNLGILWHVEEFTEVVFAAIGAINLSRRWNEADDVYNVPMLPKTMILDNKTLVYFIIISPSVGRRTV
ncbi:hypothetical protein Q0F98_32050 [Paenibacillus amylolyticus]|nr:hypothetical protein Q0F98_32050 [Paenibacillus amylolyticus]